MFAGFDGASRTQASNAGAAYVTFKPFEERAETGRTELDDRWPRCAPRWPTSTRRWCSSSRRRSIQGIGSAAAIA